MGERGSPSFDCQGPFCHARPMDPNAKPAHEPDRSFLRHFKLRWKFVGLIALLFGGGWFAFVRMPGQSFRGTAPPPTEAELSLESKLAGHLHQLASVIGARSTSQPAGLERTLVYLEEQLTSYGYRPLRIPYEVDGLTVANLEVEIIGSQLPSEIVVVGAHYDAFSSVPGANDNGSGTAAALALAERFAGLHCGRTLRFVFFTNEEPPHFQRETMGSLVYARACAKRQENIRAMWSLETVGYYSDDEGSQTYPIKLLEAAYPTRGNFIAFVGDLSAKGLVRKTVGRFRELTDFPSEAATLPGAIAGVGWSDHWSFAESGFPALMVTDTAVFRDPYYHTLEDLPERLDTASMARVVEGLGAVLAEFIDAEAKL